MAIYLKFSFIDGDVTTVGFEKWIELLSTSIAITRNTTTGAAGRQREGSHPEISDIRVTKHLDNATTKLIREAVAGQFKNRAEIRWTTTTKSKVETYFTVELDDCGITGFQQTSNPDGIPTESLALNFTRIVFTPSLLNSKGQQQQGARVMYDLQTMKAS